jgi:hypothetical protein
MATLGSLAINLTARTAGLTKGLGKAKKSIGGFGKSLRGAVGGLAPLGMSLAAGAGIVCVGDTSNRQYPVFLSEMAIEPCASENRLRIQQETISS